MLYLTLFKQSDYRSVLNGRRALSIETLIDSISCSGLQKSKYRTNAGLADEAHDLANRISTVKNAGAPGTGTRGPVPIRHRYRNARP